MKLSDSASKALESMVGELESGSSAEIVVAVAKQSGSYGDLELAIPVLTSWAVMLLLLLSPFVFPDWSLLPGVILAFLGGLGLARLPVVRSKLPTQRQRRQVQEAARATFVGEHVSATKDRTGILVYLSLRENEVEILADYGVQAVIPDAEWNTVLDRVRKAKPAERIQVLTASLLTKADLLSQRLPRSEDDRDELPNAPRLLK
jgi:putative membrane protein